MEHRFSNNHFLIINHFIINLVSLN
jgi:hypothetical protein